MLTSFQHEEITACLTEYYPIGTVRSLMPLHHPVLDQTLQSTAGTNVWRVDAQMGVFCLKRHRTGKPLSRIQFEQELQIKISQSARNMVPDPIKTIGGSSQFSVGEDWFRLERFVRSQHHAWWRQDWSAEHCRAAGRALRQFHRLTAEISQRTPDWLPTSGTACGAGNGAYVSGFGPLGKTILPSLSAAMVQARAGMRAKTREALLSSAVETCCKLAQRSGTVVEVDCSSQEMLLVHGDFHPGNVLFVGEEWKGIVDFEHVHFEEQLYDLGYAALMFCTDWTLEPEETRDLNQEFLEALLDGYNLGEDKSFGAGDLPRHLVTASILVATWLLARAPLWQVDNDAPYRCLTHVLCTWQRTLRHLGF